MLATTWQNQANQLMSSKKNTLQSVGSIAGQSDGQSNSDQINRPEL